MMHRLRQLLRGPLPGGQSVQTTRPNELRLETVREERLRREARRREAGPQEDSGPRVQRRSDATRQEEVLPESRSASGLNPGAALRTRAELRQAILLKEILDRPVSLRRPGDVGGRG